MKQLSTLVLACVFCVSALASSKSKPLADNQLDQISAGSAIATGESTATDTNTAKVELGGSSLNGASSLNIVNAADSTVGNGVNVWSGNIEAKDMQIYSPDSKKKDEDRERVKQTNVIVQKGIPCTCSPGEVRNENEEDHEQSETWAEGNAIALDGSKATNKSEFSVELSGSAEANAKALNIVNAAGSIVGNGVNVASSNNAQNLGSLTQLNVIVQSAH
jgi:hypothetical protein